MCTIQFWFGSTGRCLIVAGVLLCLSCGCVQQENAIDASNLPVTVRVEADQAQQSVSLRNGQALAVRLKSQAGTGYAWRLATAPADNPIVRLKSQQTEPDPPSASDHLGRSEWNVFTFVARRPGSADLEFVYERPWEQNVPPARRFVLSVQVK